MAEFTTIPIYRDRGAYLPGMLGQPTPKGPLVGSVLIDEDALTFEAYAFNCHPICLGNANSLVGVIRLFQQRKGPPDPGSKPGGIRDRATQRLYNP